MNSQAPPVTSPKKNLKSTFILFLAIVAGIFLFMLIAVLIGQNKGALMPSLNTYHTTISLCIALLSLCSLYFAKRIVAKEMTAAKNSLNPLTEKLNLHRSALIKYLLICEMPVMLSIILYLLTANFVFQVYAGVFLGFMLAMTPTRKKVAEQLQLDTSEQQELE